MEWQFLVALMVAIPLVLLPVAIVRYVNAGGLLRALRGRWTRRAVRSKDEGQSGGA